MPDVTDRPAESEAKERLSDVERTSWGFRGGGACARPGARRGPQLQVCGVRIEVERLLCPAANERPDLGRVRIDDARRNGVLRRGDRQRHGIVRLSRTGAVSAVLPHGDVCGLTAVGSFEPDGERPRLTRVSRHHLGVEALLLTLAVRLHLEGPGAEGRIVRGDDPDGRIWRWALN